MKLKAKRAALTAEVAMSTGDYHPSNTAINWGSQATSQSTMMYSPSSPGGSYFQEDHGLATPHSRFSQSPDYNDVDRKSVV